METVITAMNKLVLALLIYEYRELYNGEWKEDLQNDKGVERCKNGSEYDGNYRKSKKHGCTLVRKPILNFIFKLFNFWFNIFKTSWYIKFLKRFIVRLRIGISKKLYCDKQLLNKSYKLCTVFFIKGITWLFIIIPSKGSLFKVTKMISIIQRAVY